MNAPSIPGYEMLAALPRGGMSAVFKARQVSLDRVVAIKTLPPAMAADGVDIEKFMIEARITAQLKHPNIIQVYDFGKAPDGIYYFVMEYVSGYSVADWIRRKQQLLPHDTLLCAHSVAEALNYAWETSGVVHCDIKPDNVMIDGDGTVKVADLGLARSVRSVMDRAKFKAGVVIGTPYYISPEQSQGRLDLDCRADIYSLGAMLYHCLTGKMPFEGRPLLEIMDRQITDQIPDIMDLKPEISLAIACLIEKMMAKDPAGRQQDWREVIGDMTRARAGRLPDKLLPPRSASTMKRCPAREQRLAQTAAQTRTIPAPESKGAALPRRRLQLDWLAAGIMILVLAVPILLMVRLFFKSGQPSSGPPSGSAATTGLSGATAPAGAVSEVASLTSAPPAQGLSADSGEIDAAEQGLARLRLEAALRWHRSNPDKYDEACRQFEKIIAQFRGSPYAEAARNEIARIRERQGAAMAAQMKMLRDKVEPFLNRQQLREAADIFERYEGRFQTETAAERAAQARAWREQDQARQEAIRRAAESRKQSQIRQWQGILDDVAARLVDGDPGAALDVVRQVANQDALAANQADLSALAGMLAEAGRVDQRLLDSFRSHKGQELAVALTNGTELLMVRDVKDGLILADKITVVSAGRLVQAKAIRLRDLALKEKLARLGANMTPETALAHGLLAAREGNWAAAESAWRQAGPLLAAPLAAALQAREARQLEEQARHDFIALLRAAQLDIEGLSAGDSARAEARVPAEPGLAPRQPLPGCEVCLAAVFLKKYPPHVGRALAASAADFEARYGQTGLARSYAPVLAALRKAAEVFDQNGSAGKEGAPLTAGNAPDDLRTVCRHLFELNPGLTELNVSFTTNAAGKIVRAELISADLKDITPLAGLSNLNAVVCAVTRLEEWRETSFQAPLSDLSPLAGLALREANLSHTRVKDLAPLAGMPLTRLNLAGTRVTDLSVLKGMPLRELNLSRLALRDLKPLAGLPLEILNISHTEVSDLAPLAGMQLKRLAATACRIRDLTALAGLPLKDLNISRTEAYDITPLAHTTLEHLNMSQTRVRNISPLAGLPLWGLDLSRTDVRDLASLRDLRLERLNLRGTRIRDLNVLRNMPLKWLDIGETAVRDLEPIQNSAIEEIWLDYNNNQPIPTDTYRAFAAVLLRMPRLQRINGQLEFPGRSKP